MKTILITQDVRFLGVGYSVTGKAIPVEDDAATELIKLGFAEEPAADVSDSGNDDDQSANDDGRGGSVEDDTDPNRVHQKTLFDAPENKALQNAPENKQEE